VIGVDEHGRHLLGGEALHFAVVRGQGDDQQAVETLAARHTAQTFVPSGHGFDVVENQIVTGAGQHVLDSLQALDIRTTGEKGRDHGHGHRLATRKAAGHSAGRVIKFGNGGQDAAACVFAHQSAFVQDARNSAHADTRSFGHVSDCHRRHWPSFPPKEPAGQPGQRGTGSIEKTIQDRFGLVNQIAQRGRSVR